jgi:hypothetical protein
LTPSIVARECTDRAGRANRADECSGNPGGPIALECSVEFVAFAVVVPLSIGLAHAAARLMMNALLSAMTHRSRQSIR